MQKTTKILSLILSILTLLSVFSVANPVLAAEVTSESAESIDGTNVSEEPETKGTEEAEIVSEIVEDRTEYTKYFRMSDGSYMAAQYAKPVHYKENGEWKEYDYTIEENGNEFVIQNSDSEMSFPEDFSEDNEAQIEVSTRDYQIKFSPVVEKKLLNKKAKVKDHKKLKSNKIVAEFSEEAPTDGFSSKNSEKLKIDNQKSAIAYEDIYNNVDLEYEISSNQIKESIVLNSKQDKNKFEFTLDTDGLFPKKEADGSITLYEDKAYKKPVSSIAAPFMYDANGEYSYEVTMDIKEKKGTYLLTIKADNSWLNSKERKYPVVIDPSLVLDVGRTKTIDCYVDKSKASVAFPTDYYLYAGYNSYGKTRTFVQFELPKLPDNCAVIQNATINYCQYEADVGSSKGFLYLHKITSSWKNDGTVKWSAQPSYSSTVIDYEEIKSGSFWYQFDVTKLVKDWYESTSNNYGVALVSSNEDLVNRVRLYSAENTSASVYPQISVFYRNNKGLENYWSYSSYSNGTGGVAHVDNYTGNLVYELPILSSISEVMPLTLTAIFNTYCANVKYSAGKSNSSKTSVGKGYRLNIQQTVLPSTQYGLSGTAATNYPYVYADADGTEHYIAKTTENGSTVYKDEDGLGLTLVTSSTESYKYRLKDKQGNRWYFNDQGNLFCIKDANDNTIRIYYKSATDNYSANQMIDYITDGAGHKFTFAYTSETGYVKTITDNAGRAVTFTQNSSGFLTKVKYADGYHCAASYYTGSDNNGFIKRVRNTHSCLLEFEYNSLSQVKSVAEYGKDFANSTDVKGQLVTFDRSKYNTTVVRSAGLDGIHKATNSSYASDDIVTTIQFDNWGKPTSQQVSYGSGVEIGAGSASYTSDSSTLGSANKISSSASLGRNTLNLLTNGNCESTSNWVQSIPSAVTGTISNSTNSYLGAKSLYITNSTMSSSAISYLRQNVSGVTIGKTYTLSAYVKVGSISKKFTSDRTGAFIQLRACNSSGSDLGTIYSERLTAVTDSTINNGWRRLSVTLTVPENTATLRAYLCLKDCTGTVYFDGVQLEEGTVANSVNLVENSSFEKHSSYMPTSWTGAGSFSATTNSSGTVTEGCYTGTKKNGSYSLRFDGYAGQSRGIKQTIPVKGNSSDTYIVSGWAKADAVTHGDSAKFEIDARVNYTCVDSSGNTTSVTQTKTAAKFNTTISDWQYTVATFSLAYKNPASGKTYTPVSITIVPRYNYQENYAYFDHIQLIKDVAQTYTYDNDGNLISTAANSEQKYNMEYDDNNDLTSYTDAAGNKSTATYDSKHNLLSTKSAKGVLTKNAYAERGNIEATAIKTSDETLAIRTSRIFNTETTQNGFTLEAGSQITEDRDQHGYKTKYTYDHGTSTLKTVTDPKGTITTYSYNSNYTIPTGVTTAGTSVNYTYAYDRLTGITFSGTDGKSESYGFNYDIYGNTLSTKVGSQTLSTNTYASNNGVLTKTTYGNGSEKQFSYTNTGLVKSIKHNGVEKYTWEYTDTGVTKSHTDKENSLKYTYDYDSVGLLIRQEIQNLSGTHVGSTEVNYDVRNNVTKIASEFGGYTASDVYLYSSNSGNANASSYTKDNLVSRYKIDGSSSNYVDYFYDGINRLNKKTLNINGRTKISEYTYKPSNRGGVYSTTQLDTEKLDNTIYKYYYDNVGNITSITKNSGAYRSYTYDNKNQLTKEVNSTSGITTSFTYDSLGNITKKVESGNSNKTINYSYGNNGKTGWNNLLTGVDLSGNGVYESNETISYDNIGNPTTYLGASLTWFGRQLKSYTKDGMTISYTYDADGLRTSQSIPSMSCTYQYVGSLLRYETRGAHKFYYFYDPSGNLASIRYCDANGLIYTFYALTNAQGDVIAFYNESGTCVVTYEYDAWGNVVKKTDTSGINFSEINMIRYRGYYYDSNSGLYYLQSRYYNPKVGRFLNADGYITTGQGVTSYNMFAYCLSNPILFTDDSGARPVASASLRDEDPKEKSEACQFMRALSPKCKPADMAFSNTGFSVREGITKNGTKYTTVDVKIDLTNSQNVLYGDDLSEWTNMVYSETVNLTQDTSTSTVNLMSKSHIRWEYIAHRDTRDFVTNSELADLNVEETLAKMAYRGVKAVLTK